MKKFLHYLLFFCFVGQFHTIYAQQCPALMEQWNSILKPNEYYALKQSDLQTLIRIGAQIKTKCLTLKPEIRDNVLYYWLRTRIAIDPSAKYDGQSVGSVLLEELKRSDLAPSTKSLYNQLYARYLSIDPSKETLDEAGNRLGKVFYYYMQSFEDIEFISDPVLKAYAYFGLSYAAKKANMLDLADFVHRKAAQILEIAPTSVDRKVLEWFVLTNGIEIYGDRMDVSGDPIQNKNYAQYYIRQIPKQQFFLASMKAFRDRRLVQGQYVNALHALSRSYAFNKQFKESIAVWDELLQDPKTRNAYKADAYYRIGQSYHEQGNYQEALISFNRALSYKEISPDRVAQVRYRMGLVFEKLGRYQEALNAYRENIRYRKSKFSLELTFWNTKSASNDFQDAYRGMTRVWLRLNRPDSALVTFENSKSFFFNALQQQNEALLHLTPSSKNEIGLTLEQLKRARGNISRDSLNIKYQIEEARAQLQIKSQLSAQENIIGLVANFKPAMLHALQQKLQRTNQVLLEYFIDEDPDWFLQHARPERLSGVWVIGGNEFRFIDLGALAMQDIVAKLSFYGSYKEAVKDHEYSFLNTLYQLLFAPVRPYVGDAKRIVVVSDGRLNRLPFAALPTKIDEQGIPVHFLVQDFAFSASHTAAFMLKNNPDVAPSKKYNLVAIGRSHFGGRQFKRLKELSGVRTELRAIFPILRPSNMLLDADIATEDRFYQALSDTRILHIASHSITQKNLSPYYMYMILNQGQPGLDDGRIHLYELLYHQVDLDLVTLSSCSTADGQIHGGEAIDGLQTGFLTMGARSVLASIWDADDDTLPLLMKSFYEGLKRGLAKDVALQQAQLKILDRKLPVSWGNLVISGDVSQLSDLKIVIKPRVISLPEFFAFVLLLVAFWGAHRFYFKRSFLALNG